MALKWIIGDFLTGEISESNLLNVIKGSDKVSIDVNAGDSASLKVIKSNSEDWRVKYKPVEKFIALVDDEASWENGVLWAGPINKVNAAIKDTVSIQAAGLREYLARRAITSIYEGANSNPKTGVTFQAGSWQGVMREIIIHAFSATGIATGKPKPPNILGTVSGDSSGTGFKKTVLNSDFLYYSKALEEVRDNDSSGEEYLFRAKWASSAKNRIVFDAIIGTASTPHINENLTSSIPLGENSWQAIAFNAGYSADQIASRLISQSKAGKDSAGADFNVKTSNSSSILIDETFNPGVELTPAQMETQTTARLNFLKSLAKESGFERVYTSLNDLRSSIALLGRMAEFTSDDPDANYFNISMRIASVDFSASDKRVSIGLMEKAARYPKLPKNKKFTPDKPKTRDPIVPRIPDNQPPPLTGTTPGGGGGGVTPPTTPPFEIPIFEEESPLTIVGGKRMQYGQDNTSQSTREEALRKLPQVGTFKKIDNFLYALNVKGAIRNGIEALPTIALPNKAVSLKENLQVMVYNLDSPLFDTNFKAEEPYNQVFNDSTVTTNVINHRNFVSSSSISFEEINNLAPNVGDSDIIFTNQFFTNPNLTSAQYPTAFKKCFSPVSGLSSSIDFDLAVGDNFVIITALYCAANTVFEDPAGNSATAPNVESQPVSKWKLQTKSWKASRNPSTGAVGTFEDIGPIFEYDSDSGKEIFWSPGNTHIIGDKIYCFSGYKLVKEQLENDFYPKRGMAHFAVLFYYHTFLEMKLDGTGKKFTEDVLNFKDNGPTSVKLPHMMGSDSPRLNYLSSRVNGDQIIVGYGAGYNNMREYFYATYPRFKWQKVAESTNGPDVTMGFGAEILKNSDDQPAPEIIGNFISFIEPGGTRERIPVDTERSIYHTRSKIGSTDCILSNLELPKLENSNTHDKLWFTSDTRGNRHSFAALSEVKGALVDDVCHMRTTSGGLAANYQYYRGLRGASFSEGGGGGNAAIKDSGVKYICNWAYRVLKHPIINEYKSFSTTGKNQLYTFSIGQNMNASFSGSPSYDNMSTYNYFYHNGHYYLFITRLEGRGVVVKIALDMSTWK